MNVTSTLKTLLSLFLLLFTLFSCESKHAHTSNSDATDRANEAVEVKEETSPHTSEIPIKEEPISIESFQSLNKNLEEVQGIDFHYDTRARNIPLWEFRHKDSLFSVKANENDLTTYGLYKVFGKDTQLIYAEQMAEETIGEGHFDLKAGEKMYRYYFRDNEIDRIYRSDNTYHPQKTDITNTFSEDSLQATGEGIKKQAWSYFSVDTSTARFQGNWSYVGNNDNYQLNVILNQVGSFVNGNYCAYTQNMVDCGVPEQGGDPCFVNGSIHNNILHLQIKSCYTGTYGFVKLHLEKDTLHWKAHNLPTGDRASNLPKRGTFVRK